MRHKPSRMVSRSPYGNAPGISSNYVTDILVASEEEIIDAMRLTWQRMKIVIEPSSAVPLAAILRNRDVFAGKKVGVILTGGNVDLNKLPWMPK